MGTHTNPNAVFMPNPVCFFGKLLKCLYGLRLSCFQVRRGFSFVGDDVLIYEADVSRMVQRDSKTGGVPGGTFSSGKASYHVSDTRPEVGQFEQTTW